MHYDEILRTVGEFGRYQRIRFFLLCVYSVVSAWHSLNMVFVGAVQRHHCDVSDVTFNLTFFKNWTQEQLKELLIPDGESCNMYNIEGAVNLLNTSRYTTFAEYNNAVMKENFTVLDDKLLESCPKGMYFSDEMYKSTIVSDFHLVCGRKYWKSISKSVYFFGRLCGAVFFGQLSDRFGRRPTFLVCVLLLLIAGCGASAAPNIQVFLPMYFLQGAGQTGAFLVAYIQGTETVGPRYRVLTGFLLQLFYAIGYMSLSGMAYLLRDWRHLELTITVPTAIFIVYWWFLPESIRWLLSQKREEEALKILREMARVNKTQLPPDILQQLREDDVDTKKPDRKYYVIDLLRSWKMALLSINVWFNWLVNALVYYGLSLNTENLAGNPYLNFCVAGAVEIPAYVACIVLLNRVGRRWPLIVTMCVGGIACILSGCIPTKGNNDLTTVTVVLAMVGKIGITASYGIIYLMGAEVFPTVVRNVGMGMSSMSARIGGVLAPQILELRQVATPLPLVVFGVMSIVAGGLAFFLPETLNKPLPQRLEDVTGLKKGRSRADSKEDVNNELTTDASVPVKGNTVI